METGRQILTVSRNQSTEQNQNTSALRVHRIYCVKIKIKFQYYLWTRRQIRCSERSTKRDIRKYAKYWENIFTSQMYTGEEIKETSREEQHVHIVSR
jgi:ribosomal protein L16/L10AE